MESNPDEMIGFRISPLPEPNFVLAFDKMGYEDGVGLDFHFNAKRTNLARLKYWLFCKFFPFKIVRWD